MPTPWEMATPSHKHLDPDATGWLFTWLGSPGGTARRVLLSTSPKRSSDTLQGRGGGVIPEVHIGLFPNSTLSPHRPSAHVQLKDTAMVSRAFSNSLLSDSLLHS